MVEGQDGDTIVGKDGSAMKGWKWDSHLEKFIHTAVRSSKEIS